MKRTFLIALIALACIAAGFKHRAAPVTLSWDPSPAADVVGYRLYVLSDTQQTLQVLFTTQIELTVSNLATRTEYYFAVTAVASSGLESEFSNEVLYYTGK